MVLPSPHLEVGAFVLGVLDEDDNEAFETHLTVCTLCQSELRTLYGLPDLLDKIQGVRLRDRVLVRLLDDVAAARHRRQRRMQVATVAAAAVLMAAPIATAAVWSHPGGPERSPVSTAAKVASGVERREHTNPANRVTAKITILPQGWGTQLVLELSGLTGPMECELVAVPRSGSGVTVTSWELPAKHGYGVPHWPTPLRVQGGTSLPRAEIARFEVRTKDGTNLINVPA